MNTAWSEFVHDLGYDDIPDAVRKVLRRSFTDTMGVAAIGSTTEMSAITAKAADALWHAGTSGAARCLMDGRTLSPAGAAFYGAFTVDSIDAHDGSSPNKGHAGSAVFPSLLAMIDAEASKGRPVDGRRLMVLLAIAYEVSYRAGQAQHETVPDYHTSGAWTAVGVAASGAALLGASPAHIREAAGIAEYHGPRSQMMRCIDHPSMLRDGVGWGAPSGVTAAYLAQLGFTGAPAITIEADDVASFWDDLGTEWRIVSDTHYKAYPVCRWAHPSLDAVQDLMTEHRVTANMIERVRIRTFHNAIRLAGHAPQNVDELTYAIAYPVAIMIVRGQIGVEEIQPDILQDTEIQRISNLIELEETEAYNKLSVGKRWADVTLYLKDGRALVSEPRTPRGDPDLPLSDEEIATKFHLFADPIVGPERAGVIEMQTGRFDELDTNEIAALLDSVTEPTLAKSPRVAAE